MASSTTPTRRTRVGWTASGACTSGSTARHSVATRLAPGGAATTSTKASQTMDTHMNTSAGPGAHRSRAPVRSGDFVPDNLVTPRKKKRKQNEFATRTYLFSSARLHKKNHNMALLPSILALGQKNAHKS